MYDSIWPVTTPPGNPWGTVGSSSVLGVGGGANCFDFAKYVSFLMQLTTYFQGNAGICGKVVEVGITYQYLSLYLQVCMVWDELLII